ncbi:uncharacterized protein LOC135705758 [Ochlerotatus camptorhynchus]|uniref:uncharacterized protein LOC135705758 n=1 Tax=Ochlerotatus camptorhynchus TaxID=644619 RepID=UPI0031DE9547
MTNVTVVFEYEEPEYCRLCLSEATKYNELTTIGEASTDVEKGITTVIRELLKIELDPAKDKDAFICSTCVESLEEFHRYKSRCQQNNEALEKKANDRKERQIELAKSAIENTNVLDQVKDGEPIKVVIRMNAEGKASVRLQVQSKQPVKSAETSNTQPTLPVTQTIARKLIRLPKQEYYFYKTLSSNCGLIYGGYRYCASVPRKNGTHWICEQRRSHECLTLLYVDKSYNAFYLHSGHNHEPPLLRPNLHIYKANDVLAKVIEKEEQIRTIRSTKKESEQSHRECSDKELVEALSSTEMQIKDESDTESDSDEEDEEFDSRDELSDLSDSQMVSVEMLPDEVKQEPDSKADPTPAASSHVKIDAGENTYIIQELT